MRENKYRGLRIDGRGWVYGDLVQTNQFTYILSTSFIPVISLPSDYFTEVDEKTVSQFTGLTDKNGTEIYEGDIIEFENKTKGKIAFFEACYQIIDMENNPIAGYLLASFNELIVVTGNIHQQLEQPNP